MILAGNGAPRPRPLDRWTEVFERNGYTPALNERDRQLAAAIDERDELAAVLAVLLDLVTSLLADVPDVDERDVVIGIPPGPVADLLRGGPS